MIELVAKLRNAVQPAEKAHGEMMIKKQKSALRMVRGAVPGLLLALLIAMPAAAEPTDAEIEFWRSVKETSVPEELQAYLNAYPSGAFAELARIRLKNLRGDAGGKESEPISAPKERTEQSPPIDSVQILEDMSPGAAEAQPSGTEAKPENKATATQLSTSQGKDIRVVLGPNPKDASMGAAGIFIDDVSGLPRALGLDASGGVLVSALAPGGPAEKSGLKPGFLIVAVDGMATPDAATLAGRLRSNPPGTTVTLKAIELAPTRQALEELLDGKAESAPEAAYALALLTKDDAKVAALFRKAAEQGYAPAAYRLAKLYEKGSGGLKKSASEAMRWRRKAADMGITVAMFDVGVAYAQGHGVKRDRKEAAEWFRKAADRGSADAMANLGHMYEKGLGVAQDYSEAAKWYLKSVDLGQATARNNLGLLYDKGKGVPQDSEAAARLLLLAYRNGQAYAKQNLEKNSAALRSETRRAVQQRLKQEGVYDGAIDGRFGSGTRRALKAFAAQKTPQIASEQPAGTGLFDRPAETSASGGSTETDLDLGDLGDLGTLD